MKSAYEVIEEVGRSLHTGDHALLILRKWGEEIIEECSVTAGYALAEDGTIPTVMEQVRAIKKEL